MWVQAVAQVVRQRLETPHSGGGEAGQVVLRAEALGDVMGTSGHAVPRQSGWCGEGPASWEQASPVSLHVGSWLPSELALIWEPLQIAAFSVLKLRWNFERLNVFVDLFPFWPSLLCIADCYSKNRTSE